jgi:hypothetical protein
MRASSRPRDPDADPSERAIASAAALVVRGSPLQGTRSLVDQRRFNLYKGFEHFDHTGS